MAKQLPQPQQLGDRDNSCLQDSPLYGTHEKLDRHIISNKRTMLISRKQTLTNGESTRYRCLQTKQFLFICSCGGGGGGGGGAVWSRGDCWWWQRWWRWRLLSMLLLTLLLLWLLLMWLCYR
jgi:hypothetical protein